MSQAFPWILPFPLTSALITHPLLLEIISKVHRFSLAQGTPLRKMRRVRKAWWQHLGGWHEKKGNWDRDPKLFLSSGAHEHLHGTCILIQNPTTIQPSPVTSSLLFPPSTLSDSCLLVFLIVLAPNMILYQGHSSETFRSLGCPSTPSRSSSVFPLPWWWFPTTAHGHAILLFLLLEHGYKSCWYLGGIFCMQMLRFLNQHQQPDNS